MTGNWEAILEASHLPKTYLEALRTTVEVTALAKMPEESRKQLLREKAKVKPGHIARMLREIEKFIDENEPPFIDSKQDQSPGEQSGEPRFSHGQQAFKKAQKSPPKNYRHRARRKGSEWAAIAGFLVLIVFPRIMVKLALKPLEYLKLSQVLSPEHMRMGVPTKSSSGHLSIIWDTFRSVGTLGPWYGFGASAFKDVLHRSIFRKVKKLFEGKYRTSRIVTRILIFPIDVLIILYTADAVAMAADLNYVPKYPGNWFTTLWRFFTDRGMYGFGAGLVLSVMAMSLTQETWTAMYAYLLYGSQDKSFLLAEIISLVSTALAHPLHSVAHRMLISAGSPFEYASIWDALTSIYNEEGITGLFNGIFWKAIYVLMDSYLRKISNYGKIYSHIYQQKQKRG